MIKKQCRLPFALLLGSLLTGGCVSTADEPAEDAVPISFSTATTRAAVDTDKTGMENFLAWGGFDNENNLFNAETVTPEGYYQGTRYWAPDKIHNFYALHPASLTDAASCVSNGTITVTGFDTSIKRGTEAIDLMTASKTDISYNEGTIPTSVTLAFKHELSRVRFTIHTDADVTIDEVKLWGIKYKGNFNSKFDAASSWSDLITATQTGTPFSQADAFELEAGASRHLLAGTNDAANDKYGDLLLIPQIFPEMPESSESPDLSGTAVFYMAWTYENSTKRTVTVPLWQAGPTQWEKGMSYQYSATIPPPATDIKFTVTITDWNDKRIDADL